MNSQSPAFRVSLARTEAELQAAFRLRYDVFIDELGGSGPLVDHNARLERDSFDEHATQLILRDELRPPQEQIVGVYRFMTSENAAAAGQFYCEDEYDLDPLKQSGKRLLEVGRSCLHPEYRGGSALVHLWSGLSDFVARHEIDLVFGVASFHGSNVADHAEALSWLNHTHLAPEPLRVEARAPGAAAMDRVPFDQIDRVAAMRAIPALIKAYLRFGGVVGKGAFVDLAFNTVDVCMILEAASVGTGQRGLIAKGAGLG